VCARARVVQVRMRSVLVPKEVSAHLLLVGGASYLSCQFCIAICLLARLNLVGLPSIVPIDRCNFCHYRLPAQVQILPRLPGIGCRVQSSVGPSCSLRLFHPLRGIHGRSAGLRRCRRGMRRMEIWIVHARRRIRRLLDHVVSLLLTPLWPRHRHLRWVRVVSIRRGRLVRRRSRHLAGPIHLMRRRWLVRMVRMTIGPLVRCSPWRWHLSLGGHWGVGQCSLGVSVLSVHVVSIHVVRRRSKRSRLRGLTRPPSIRRRQT